MRVITLNASYSTEASPLESRNNPCKSQMKLDERPLMRNIDKNR